MTTMAQEKSIDKEAAAMQNGMEWSEEGEEQICIRLKKKIESQSHCIQTK